jgi:hypothetical protein
LREKTVSSSRVRGFRGGGELEVVKWKAGGEELVVARCEEGWTIARRGINRVGVIRMRGMGLKHQSINQHKKIEDETTYP